jgi:tetratricopeptide (TPR) repeat protein
LPHVRLCGNHICRDNYLESVQTDLKRLKEVQILRTVLLYHRQLPYAEDLTRWTLVRYEEALGEDYPDTLTTVNCMGEVLEKQGRYDSALEFFQRALTGREKISKDHPDTLTTVNCIVSVLDSQGKYNESIEQYERALRGREKALGMDHPDTLTTVDNMALVLNKLGRYDKALEWHRRALKGREERLGENHPDTLTTVINMA